MQTLIPWLKPCRQLLYTVDFTCRPGRKQALAGYAASVSEAVCAEYQKLPVPAKLVLVPAQTASSDDGKGRQGRQYDIAPPFWFASMWVDVDIRHLRVKIFGID